MNRYRINEFITRPAFISLLIWIILILSIHPTITKYRIKHIGYEITQLNCPIFYDDLDSDGNSEKISVDLNDSKQTKIIVSRDNRIIDQYNLKYQPPAGFPFYTDDYNRDGFKECYLLTMSMDSIFLNVFDPVGSKRIIVTNRFIDFRRIALNSDDAPQFIPVGMSDNKKNGLRDIVFIINTGYSLQPRNLYRYIVDKDSLLKSPESGAVLSSCAISDLNNDTVSEFILNTHATGNMDEEFPYTDKYLWLMVLDNELKYNFPPVRFAENPSRMQLLPLKAKGQTLIVLFVDYYGNKNYTSAFYMYDPNGNKLFEKSVLDFENFYSQLFPGKNPDKQTFYFLKNRDAEIDEMDTSFRIVNTLVIPGIYVGAPLSIIDADNDGKKEYIFMGDDKKSLIITQNDFRNAVTLTCTKVSGSPRITNVFRKGGKPLLYLQYNEWGRFIQYYRSPYFRLRYPIYGAFYLAITLFVFFLSRIQQYRLWQKQEMEKKIAALQMKSIKNQIDPHFTLNILNAIGSLYATEENRDKADYVFSKYAKLIRQTVISSDQIIVELAEEIDFVRNYLDLERFRSNNSFSFSIEVGENVDTRIKIPRMLIHTFTENAVKYAIRNKPGGGVLKISANSAQNRYSIIVEDNGPGLQNNEITGSGTAKGLLLLNELIDLYFRLEKVKISYTLDNIVDNSDIISGVRATIYIPYQSPKS